MPSKDLNRAAAWKFIILLGVVSLCSDMTHEGARSITGPFLGSLNASATVVGIVAGLGEFIGYVLRLVSGYLTDRLGKYWLITFVGYAMNLFAVPLLALAGSWQIAAVLVLWGIGMGGQASIIKAALADMVPKERRATGYGIFNCGFGLFWFLGSALMGLLYDVSLSALIAFSVIIQLLAIPLFALVARNLCFTPR